MGRSVHNIILVGIGIVLGVVGSWFLLTCYDIVWKFNITETFLASVATALILLAAVILGWRQLQAIRRNRTASIVMSLYEYCH